MARPRFTTKVAEQLITLVGQLPPDLRDSPAVRRAVEFTGAMAGHIRSVGAVTRPRSRKPKAGSRRTPIAKPKAGKPKVTTTRSKKARKRKRLVPEWQVLARQPVGPARWGS